MRLTEIFETKFNLDESADGTLRLRIPFLEADKATANGRTYPLNILKNAITELKKTLARGLAYGGTRHQERLEVDDVSHSIEDIQLEGKNAVATIRVLPTEKGQNLLAILRHGGKVGVSARGRGEVQTVEGQQIVKEGYSLEGLDFCLNPASGKWAGMEMVCESAPLDLDENDNPGPTEKELDARYVAAVHDAGYRGTKEAFVTVAEDPEALTRLAIARERYRRAIDAGYIGSLESYLDSLPQEKK